jgi:RHS repeat-associated protein
LQVSGAWTVTNAYAFSTKQKDTSGLVYYGARYYNPQIGRWTQRDPMGFVDGPNVYAFVGNNPVNFVDPYGLWKGFFPGQGPEWHHEGRQARNNVSTLPTTRPTNDLGSWASEGEMATHGGLESFRGMGSNAGRQAVYDKAGNLVVTGEDAGSFDYYSPYFTSIPVLDLNTAAKHFLIDVVPWILWGNDRVEEKSTCKE